MKKIWDAVFLYDNRKFAEYPFYFFHRKDIHLVKTYTCTKCGNTYTESIPATNHTYQSKIIKATNKKNGSIAQVCSKYGTQKGKKTIIYKAKNIKLSKTPFTYNNKFQKPSFTVKDSKGKALKKGKDYTVTDSKGMKNVGKYTI